MQCIVNFSMRGFVWVTSLLVTSGVIWTICVAMKDISPQDYPMFGCPIEVHVYYSSSESKGKHSSSDAVDEDNCPQYLWVIPKVEF